MTHSADSDDGGIYIIPVSIFDAWTGYITLTIPLNRYISFRNFHLLSYVPSLQIESSKLVLLSKVISLNWRSNSLSCLLWVPSPQLISKPTLLSGVLFHRSHLVLLIPFLTNVSVFTCQKMMSWGGMKIRRADKFEWSFLTMLLRMFMHLNCFLRNLWSLHHLKKSTSRYLVGLASGFSFKQVERLLRMATLYTLNLQH